MKMFIVKKLIENMHNIQLAYISQKSQIPQCVFDEIYSRIKTQTNLFIENYKNLPKKKLIEIDSNISNIKYHNEKNIKSKLFEYIEILNELNIFLDFKLNKNIISIKDNIIDEIQRFIFFLSDSASHEL